MGFFIDRKETFPITVYSPDGEEATVELRKLTAGDMADRQSRMFQVDVRIDPKSGRPQEDTKIDIGGARLFTIYRSIVSWSLPRKVSFDAVKDLDALVVDQIYEEIRKLNPAISREEFDLAGEPSENEEDPTPSRAR
ncbi:MAG: hypothetical protein K6T51_01280 [Rubrobacteraceae bacterium]|nr:hypothetical protein [Rubrobacteraceae bacterium]